MDIPKRKKTVSLEKLHLTHPQRDAVASLLAGQKNKYKKLLHETHERLHVIADLTRSLEIWFNINGSYEHVSHSCEGITGYAREAFLFNRVGLEQLIHPDSLERYQEARKNARLGISGEDVEYKFIRKDGAVRWALASWTPVYTRRGRQIGIRISIMDITEQKFCRARLRNSELLFRTLAGLVSDTAVAIVTAEGTLTYWNDAVRHITGYSRKDLEARKIGTLFAGDGTFDALVAEPPLATAGILETRADLRKKSGASIPVRLTLVALRDSDDTTREYACFLVP